MKHNILLAIAILVGSVTAHSQNLERVDSLSDVHTLKRGDLLFGVNLDGNAITKVMHVGDNLPIDHVGIVYSVDGDEPVVIEAAPAGGVALAKLSKFFEDNSSKTVGRPTVVVGRLTVPFDTAYVLQHSATFLGRPYDYLFENTDSALYCSELVQKSYRTTQGKEIFHTVPMNFQDKPGHILPQWIEYYRKRGHSVPQGEPGTHPAEQARDPQVRIIYRTW